MTDNKNIGEKIAILDCGGQYTKVIDRKIRELGVKSDIFPIGAETGKLKEYKALVLSGGPASVYGDDAPEYNPEIFDMGLPILGICYGFHLITHHFGGIVKPNIKSEYKQAEIDIDTSCELFDGLNKKELVLMSHGDSVEKIADGFECAAKTGGVVAAVYNRDKKIAAVQFHPEVELTENGVKIFENFLRKICGLKEYYELEDRIETSVNMIRAKAGKDGKVIVLVSGGVDSMVTAALLLKALPPENIYAIHVDHGFMRKNESDLTCRNLEKLGFKNLLRINAQDKFLHTKVEIEDGKIAGPLADVTDPEVKRRIIGSLFIEVVKEAAETFNLDYDKTFIAQGTLRPDLIESGNPDVSSHANRIKTHHNDVDIVRKARAKGLIIETNWDWHKDEVRQVARMLGIDEEIASRQPFPGPGLAVRQICSAKDIVIDENNRKMFDEMIKTLNLRGTVAPILSVGVQGDMRSYKHLAVLYGGGTETDFSALSEAVSEIPNKLNFINRCVYVLNKKDIAADGIKCSELTMSRENTELLREIDYIITDEISKWLKNTDNPYKINQYFGVLIPITGNNAEKKYSAVIRAVITTDFMTAKAAVPGKDIPAEIIRSISERIETEMHEIDLVLYDITGKPPATVEWE